MLCLDRRGDLSVGEQGPERAWAHHHCGLYSIHPASVQYTTFLGTTIFTVLFIAVFEYLLWKIGKGTGSIILLAVVTILMIYTRSIFHWPFIIVCALSLLLLDQERRSIRKFLDIVMIAVGLLYVKQLLQFGIIKTSSFSGYVFCSGCGGY
jgi:hypothetical protein